RIWMERPKTYNSTQRKPHHQARAHNQEASWSVACSVLGAKTNAADVGRPLIESAGSVMKYDVIGIGNAIVDVITQADDAFIQEHALAKGTMRLIDARQASDLYDHMNPGRETSGGSVANTCAGVASFGGKVA